MNRGVWTMVAGLLTAGILHAPAQIDPTRRELIQLGFNAPLEGHGPPAAYAYYYLNKPNLLSNSNLTLRLAVAPVYLDSELGISRALGEYTDVGLGLAGGGFADSYFEVDQGKYERKESFIGHGGEVSSSIYHLFNPASRIPLNGVLRGAVHYSLFADDADTAGNFSLPEDQVFFRVRTGLRFGGREPVMLPDLAMELSVWYEGEFRAEPNRYGYNGDRTVESSSHLFWGRGLLTYAVPEQKHNFGVSLTAGSGLNLDRFSAYRLGGNLPLSSEFPLSLPGYYYQELSAQSFVLLAGSYSIALDAKQHFRASVTAATGWVDYLDGLSQPRNWNSGVGGGLVFRSPSDSWQVAVAYGYGFDAIRGDDRGAQSVSILVQFDLDRVKRRLFDPSASVPRSGGMQHFFRGIFR